MATPRAELDPAYVAENILSRWLGITGTLTVLATIIVLMRVYVRAWMMKAFGYDDGFMVVAITLGIAGYALCIWQGNHGLGRHFDTLSRADQVEFGRIGFMWSLVTALFAFMFLKISIALNLMRLCKVINPWYRRSLWGLIVFVVLYHFMASLTLTLICNPIEGYWNPYLTPRPKCYPFKMFIEFGVVNTSFNIATDIAFATLPIPIIWNLQMRLRTRVYLVAVLSLGYFAVALGVVKAVYQIAYGSDPDRSFMSAITLYGHIQFCVGVLASCAATLKPLVGRILKLGGDTNAYPTRGITLQQSNGAGRKFGGSSMGNKSRSAAGNGYSKSWDHDVEGDGSLELGRMGEETTGKGKSMKLGRSRKDKVYDGGGSGSEEMIIQGRNTFLGEGGGITKTREIKVERELR